MVGSVDVSGATPVDLNVGIAGKLAMGGIVPRCVCAGREERGGGGGK